MLLMIDNYDSFTYNLYQYFAQLGVETMVKRNDQITLQQIADLAPQYLVISPGPCTPNEAGISLAAIERFSGEIPLLGVCLGHQSIGQVFGAQVERAKQVMHGKTCPIEHQQQGVFKGLNQPLTVTRYHSLLLAPESMPDCLEVTAFTEHLGRYEIMGIRHRELAVQGVQFHPESIMSQQGLALLQNFILQSE